MSNNIIKQDIEEQQGKKSSLWHLVSHNAIVIPIIQRDYAQGRTNDDVRQIRESFLKKIFKVLADEHSQLELDFIYGTLEAPKDISLKTVNYENFVPLDGQQRLTTLFLLHWFLALWNEGDFEHMRTHFKGRFSYATRLSSSDFCSELLEHVCSHDVVDNIIKHKKDQISGLLKNEGWFHNQWENDPTISGMLNMLDTMFSLFNDVVADSEKPSRASTFFKRLTCNDIDKTAITFNLLYLNRGDFHLSDELYIKMNSRGKPLSDFETFKARFESFLAKFAKDKSDFAGNIDGKWADLFWELRNNIRPKSVDSNEEGQADYYRDNTDSMMMNVIKVALANKYAILTENNDNGLDELFESQVAKKANPDLHLTFYRYTELGVFNEINDDEISDEKEKLISSNNNAVCVSVYNAFSFLYDIKKSSFSGKYLIDSEFMNVDDYLNNILFYGIDGKYSAIPSISYQTRLMFWALSEYCIKYKENIQNCTENKCIALNRWMRFIRNMVESAEYNTVYDMQNALKFLHLILSSLDNNGDIIQYLSQITETPECAPFPQSQIKEEVLKAQLISCDAQWEDSIIGADNVESWPGRSGYLLYFSGLSDKSYDDIQLWDTAKHNCYRGLYDTYKKKMDVLLSYLNKTNFKEECLFERALLSKGNYLRREDIQSIIYSMMDQHVSSRSYSFRQMVQYNGIDSNNDTSVYKEGVECLKKILDDSLYVYTSKETAEKSLRNIIKKSLNSIDDWRRPLLNNKRIWHEALQRFMWIDKGMAWVVKNKGGRTNQYETWSYHLYQLLHLKGLRYGYYPHTYPQHTVLSFKVGEQMYQLKISHTSSGHWQFDMIAIDENYQPITLDLDMRKTILELMPNNARSFIKKNIRDTLVWADAMQYCIEQRGELL